MRSLALHGGPCAHLRLHQSLGSFLCLRRKPRHSSRDAPGVPAVSCTMLRLSRSCGDLQELSLPVTCSGRQGSKG